MKNMIDKLTKWSIVAGGLMLCAVLMLLIGQRFQTPKPADDPFPTANPVDNPLPTEKLVVNPILPKNSVASDATTAPNEPDSTEKEIIVVPPAIPQPSRDNGAISDGTEQTIQGNVSKPEYTEEQLRDPTQKPNGENVTEEDKAVEHNEVKKPMETPKNDNQPQGGDTKDGKIYVPGFGWIDDHGGGGQGITVDGDGDINKQVGTMN